MSNFIVGGWSALKADLHFATELYGRSCGPDDAVARIKHGLSEVLVKFEKLAIEEAAKVAPVVEQAAESAVDTALKSAAPVIEEKLGEPGAAIAESALGVAANVGEQVVEHAVDVTLATTESAVAAAAEAPAAEAPAAETK
jgi:hypothetical protein